MLDSQPVFKDVFKKFLTWLEKENLLEPGVKFAFATSGDPDLDYLLPVQCKLSGIDVPEFMKQWINVKRSFCEVSPYTWPDNLTAMVKLCGLEHVGELHSGLDDAINIARVMASLADRGVVFRNN
ncbi:ERI1 exoribonuclease 3, partial [Stegodyphus mimosarum]